MRGCGRDNQAPNAIAARLMAITPPVGLPVAGRLVVPLVEVAVLSVPVVLLVVLFVSVFVVPDVLLGVVLVLLGVVDWVVVWSVVVVPWLDV
jgi:hypothetical protein